MKIQVSFSDVGPYTVLKTILLSIMIKRCLLVEIVQMFSFRINECKYVFLYVKTLDLFVALLKKQNMLNFKL